MRPAATHVLAPMRTAGGGQLTCCISTDPATGTNTRMPRRARAEDAAGCIVEELNESLSPHQSSATHRRHSIVIAPESIFSQVAPSDAMTHFDYGGALHRVDY
jgi:hypothetical protein